MPSQFTIAQAARRLGVSSAVVSDWIATGLISAITRPAGEPRISAAEVQRARHALGFHDEPSATRDHPRPTSDPTGEPGQQHTAPKRPASR